jgi:predicted PurR-regulated permease PerM
VKLSPLAILISVLIGAEVAGVIGALGAIPVAGTIQIIISDWLQHRRPPASPPDDGTVTESGLELPASATAANAP